MTQDTNATLDEIVAFNEPARRRLVDLLAANGPSTVTTLARAVGAQVGSVSHHLRTLERAGFVERVPELATDARTSWWRLVDKTWAWSPEDFDRPVDRHQARAAQRLATRHHAAMLHGWQAGQADHSEAWRRAAFSTTTTTRATAEELDDLLVRLAATVDEWQQAIPTDDDQTREPVIFFGYGFPVATSVS